MLIFNLFLTKNRRKKDFAPFSDTTKCQIHPDPREFWSTSHWVHRLLPPAVF